MSRIRIKIGQLVLHHSDMTSAEGARLGRMVEAHLEKLMVTGGAPAARNAGVVSVSAPLNAGKGASHADTASAIATGIHQGLRGRG